MSHSSPISFFIPAYNCASTITESVQSIMQTNFDEGDELIITNDGSTDDTEQILNDLKKIYPAIKILKHPRNKGGGAARNTAVENSKNEILFCLDSDNILVPESIPGLKSFLVEAEADIAALQQVHFFLDDNGQVSHKSEYRPGKITFADCLAGWKTPPSSGNYMFTRESWVRAGGYPEFNFLDTWGFGIRQLATGSRMMVMPNTHYYHRYGHDSYWVREKKTGNTSLRALQILIPFLDLLEDKDVDYLMSRKGRYTWFDDLDNRPIKLKGCDYGQTGQVIYLQNENDPKKGLGKYVPAQLRPLIKKIQQMRPK
jgi:glycosyltransferase involved in cell wall biosynthesis